jgi:hypothetical protein
MRLFLDAEFVAPSFHLLPVIGIAAMQGARLLSLGVVPEQGDELYVEVEDRAARAAASDFVKLAVLPQLGLVPATRVPTDAAAGEALADYLSKIPGKLTLTADFSGDLKLVIQALRSAGRLPGLMDRLEFDTASWVAAPGTESVWSAAFERGEEETGLLRHHALLDARVLREVFGTLSAAA